MMKHHILCLLTAVCLCLSLLAVPAAAAESSGTATGFDNERVIYEYLTEELGLPTSSACGLLASAYRESGFRPEVQNKSGTSLGIFQWYGDFMDMLVDWCLEAGYDADWCVANGYDLSTYPNGAYTLEGQLAFLTYLFTEVSPYTTYYQDLLAMPETAQGAYDAGYYFCYYFERPANRQSVSEKRGAYARDTYWAFYGDNGWENPFLDVSPSNWYYDSVAYVCENGLFNGTAEDMFTPYGEMSRAMMAQVLYNLAGQPAVSGNVEDYFTDTSDSKWYADAVLWAKTTGVVNGKTEITFEPNTSVTREEMVTMLYNYCRMTGLASTESSADLSAYPDASQVSFGQSAMAWAVEIGILNGVKTDTGVYLAPKDLANRASVATLFRGFCEAAT